MALFGFLLPYSSSRLSLVQALVAASSQGSALIIFNACHFSPSGFFKNNKV
jgi:hypothetical protein